MTTTMIPRIPVPEVPDLYLCLRGPHATLELVAVVRDRDELMVLFPLAYVSVRSLKCAKWWGPVDIERGL